MDAHFQFWPKGLPHDLNWPQTTLCHNLEVSAARFPGKTAIVYEGAEISYARLLQEVNALAGYLQQRCGVARGDRVAIFSQNCPQFVIAYYAILRAGGVVVPVNVMSTTPELRYIAEHSDARLVLAGSELMPVIVPCLDGPCLEQAIVYDYDTYRATPPEHAAAPAAIEHDRITHWRDSLAAGLEPGALEVTRDDLCLLPFTSGTTGKAKGCMHTHATVMSALYAMMQWRRIHAESVLLAVAPMFHLLGMQNGMNLPILAGATAVMMTRWDRETAAELMQRHRVTNWSAPPAMIIDFMANPTFDDYDLSSLVLLTGGGAAIPDAISARLHDRLGLICNEAYGMTETASFLHCNPLEHTKRGSLGVPTFGVSSRIVDPVTLEDLPDGEVGELITAGPQIMQGYWKNPQANAESFIERDGRRYLRTGDLAHRDADGYFFMRDRLKRMINVSGYKVWPAEVENVMYEHPAVHEVCIIAVQDERRGETVKAVIVLRPDSVGRIGEQDIIDWARGRMAVYKAPRQVEFVDHIPKSGTGKLLWKVLQDRERAEAPVQA